MSMGGQNLLGEAVLSLRTDQAGLDSGLDQAHAKSQGFVGRAQSTLNGFSDSLTRTGQKMTLGLTTPILGIGLAILNTAKNFESGMNRVGALTNATDRKTHV